MSTHYKFIDDNKIDDMRFFWETVLKPEATHEIISLSLSVREKLLSWDVRKLFPEFAYAMFQRRSVYGNTFEMFLRSVRSYEAHKGFITSEVDGVSTPPQEALRVYVNINRTDGRIIPAFLVEELCRFGFSLSYVPESEQEKATERMVKLCIKGGDRLIQQKQSIKNWSDYDLDMEEMPESYGTFTCDVHNVCTKYLPIGSFMLISSPNGLHIMVKNGSFKCNPKSLLDDIVALPYKFKEALRNKNDMLVLPGTLAYNKAKQLAPITIINKSDFQ